MEAVKYYIQDGTSTHTKRLFQVLLKTHGFTSNSVRIISGRA